MPFLTPLARVAGRAAIVAAVRLGICPLGFAYRGSASIIFTEIHPVLGGRQKGAGVAVNFMVPVQLRPLVNVVASHVALLSSVTRSLGRISISIREV